MRIGELGAALIREIAVHSSRLSLGHEPTCVGIGSWSSSHRTEAGHDLMSSPARLLLQAERNWRRRQTSHFVGRLDSMLTWAHLVP